MRVQIQVFDWVDMKRSAMQRIEKCKRENLCVACLESLEGEKKVVRGCHERCYAATQKARRLKKFTESQRVAEGKFLAKEPGGRKPSNPVTVEAAGS